MRPTIFGKRCSCSPRRNAPNGTSSSPIAVGLHRLHREEAGVAEGTPPPNKANAPTTESATAESGIVCQNQAEQILNSMDRRERETREEQQRRLQNSSAAGVKDW